MFIFFFSFTIFRGPLILYPTTVSRREFIESKNPILRIVSLFLVPGCLSAKKKSLTESSCCLQTLTTKFLYEGMVV